MEREPPLQAQEVAEGSVLDRAASKRWAQDYRVTLEWELQLRCPALHTAAAATARIETSPDDF